MAALDAPQTTVRRVAACVPQDSGGTGWCLQYEMNLRGSLL